MKTMDENIFLSLQDLKKKKKFFKLFIKVVTLVKFILIKCRKKSLQHLFWKKETILL